MIMMTPNDKVGHGDSEAKKQGVCTKLAISKGDMTEDDKIKGGGNYGHKS